MSIAKILNIVRSVYCQNAKCLPKWILPIYKISTLLQISKMLNNDLSEYCQNTKYLPKWILPDRSTENQIKYCSLLHQIRCYIKYILVLNPYLYQISNFQKFNKIQNKTKKQRLVHQSFFLREQWRNLRNFWKTFLLEKYLTKQFSVA